MVSIPCHSIAAAPLPKLPLLHWNRPSVHLTARRPPARRTRPHSSVNGTGTNTYTNPSGFEPQMQQQSQPRTLFPGGFKRAEIKVPTLVLDVSAEEILNGGESSRKAVDVAVSKGMVGIVVLHGGDGSGGRLYEAACALQGLVRDRAYLLISERVDIAAAVGASGVVLSDQGLPAIVARGMMTRSKSESVVLPLVARTVQTSDAAATASSSEGADFLIIVSSGEKYDMVLQNFILDQHVKVPVFISMVDMFREVSPYNMASKLFQSGASGMVLSLDDMKLVSDDIVNKLFSEAISAGKRNEDGPPNFIKQEITFVKNDHYDKKLVAGFTKLDAKELQLIEEERVVLLEVISIIRKAAPLMKEVSLLVDAVCCLDQPFLLVVVGEFNSGKSTVINALLGKRYLKDGVVPTTNEITLLSYSETDSNGQQRCERHPDGQFICYLSAPILKEMNIVDTPGTNVILQRQQRLTEEYVPRADLVLFVLSSDRPLTESEVAFLRYVQQWKKKVIFVLNKSDLYRNTSELEEAIAFITENTQKLLTTEHVTLFPVSARSALEAKLYASLSAGRNLEELLSDDSCWTGSGLGELENFLFSFLDGSTDTGMERMKLKLETPISIADRLLSTCETLVKRELEYAVKDLSTVEKLVSSVKEYTLKLESESIPWKQRTSSLVEKAKARAIKLIDSTLQLSNIDLIATYAFKGGRSSPFSASLVVQSEVLTPVLSDAQGLLGEYLSWLHSNSAHEGKLYLESFEKRWPGFINLKDQTFSETSKLLDKGEEHCIGVLKNFRAAVAASLFEQEIREVVLGTFGGLGAAGLSASLLTSVLPTTLEDLLALAFCSTGGFLAISRFPARRKEAIEKVGRVADGLARDIEEAMHEDLLQVINKLEKFVEFISKPYMDAAQSKINRLSEMREELALVGQKLKSLKIEIQNIHVS